jgi:hypothetical protein
MRIWRNSLWFGKARKVRSDLIGQIDTLDRLLKKEGRKPIESDDATTRGPKADFICKVKAAGLTDPPQDCDWPWCGCDPHADRVLAALQEEGRLTAGTSVPNDATARSSLVPYRNVSWMHGKDGDQWGSTDDWYRASCVDAMLAELRAEVSRLQQENALLRRSLAMLTKQIEEAEREASIATEELQHPRD